MLGMSDFSKMAKEIERLHELTDETAKLVKEVKVLNGLIKELVIALQRDVPTKRKKRST